MQGPNRERWFRLCQEIAVEENPVKMLELVTELNSLLEEKEKRLEELRKSNPHPANFSF